MIGSPLAPARPMLVGPPGLYVLGDDHLLVTSLNAAASVALAIGGRVLRLDGTIVPFEQRHTPNTDRTAATVSIRLAEGWLQGVTVVASSGAPIVGQTYVRIDLVRGEGAGRTTLATLVAGGVTAQLRRAWPGSPLVAPLDGAGAIRSITGTDPAAGAEWSETVPTGARWRLLTVSYQLVTDATVANRESQLVVDDGTTIYHQALPGVVQTASLTRRYSWGHGTVATATAGTSGDRSMPMPPMILAAGHRVRSSTPNIVAGDNYGAPQLLVEEWLEGAA